MSAYLLRHWQVMFQSPPYTEREKTSMKGGISYMRSMQPTLNITSAHGLQVAVHQNLNEGIGAVVWDSVLYLIDFLSWQANAFITGKSCLDIATGTGVASLVCAMLGASAVTLTDVVKYNVCEENMLMCQEYQCGVDFVSFDWKESSVPSILTRNYDTVICSDVLYDRTLFADLQKTLKQLNFNVLLLAYKQRHPEHEIEFFAQLSEWADVKEIVIPASRIATFENSKTIVLTGLHILQVVRKDMRVSDFLAEG